MSVVHACRAELRALAQLASICQSEDFARVDCFTLRRNRAVTELCYTPLSKNGRLYLAAQHQIAVRHLYPFTRLQTEESLCDECTWSVTVFTAPTYHYPLFGRLTGNTVACRQTHSSFRVLTANGSPSFSVAVCTATAAEIANVHHSIVHLVWCGCTQACTPFN